MLLKVNESSVYNTYVLEYNNLSYNLSSNDVDGVFFSTATLIDDDYIGPAIIELGSKTVVMDQSDWEKLYDITEQFLQYVVEGLSAEMEVEMAGVVIH